MRESDIRGMLPNQARECLTKHFITRICKARLLYSLRPEYGFDEVLNEFRWAENDRWYRDLLRESFDAAMESKEVKAETFRKLKERMGNT